MKQNGATPHISSNTLLWLRLWSEDWLISRWCDIEWAPHSPNSPPPPPDFYLWGLSGHHTLTQSPPPPPPPPPDFYLWGYLKDWVYENNLQTIDDLTDINSHDQGKRNVLISLTVSCATCKCACNAKGVIWNTLWREHRTIWPTNWKLCEMIMHQIWSNLLKTCRSY